MTKVAYSQKLELLECSFYIGSTILSVVNAMILLDDSPMQVSLIKL